MLVKKTKMKKQVIITGVLAILLLIAISYIGYVQYQGRAVQEQEEQKSIFTQGAQIGYQQAILEIFQKLAKCETVPLFVEDKTLNAIAVECLQQTR